MSHKSRKKINPQQPAQKIADIFAEAVRCHQQQLFEKALTGYQKVLAQQPTFIDALINSGTVLKSLGRIDEAIATYQQALQLKPDSPELWYNLGNTLQIQGKFDSAINAYRQAIKLSPNLAPAYFNLGKLLQEQENYQEAATCYRRTIELQPNLARAYTNLGNTLKALGDIQNAIKYHRKAIELQPNYAEAHYNLGNAFQAQKQYELSLQSYQKALVITPDFPEAKLNLSATLQALNRLEEAEETLKQLVANHTNFKQAYLSLGNLLQQQQQYSAAETYFRFYLQLEPGDKLALESLIIVLQMQSKYEEAINLLLGEIKRQPDFANAYCYLGSIYNEIGRYYDAISCLEQAISYDAKLATAYNNLGYAKSQISQLSEALEACNKALEINPQLIAAIINKGYALNNQGLVSQATACFREVLRIDPDYYIGHSNLLYCLNYDPANTPEIIAQAHKNWAEHFTSILPPPKAYRNSKEPERKLRIGYVSPDFRQHSVAYFIESILQHHDKKQFEIFAYANVALPDTVTDRLCKLVDNWCNIYKLDDEAFAKQVRRDRIDILVDLAGHTGNNRLLAFLHKPAPIQITYIGYPNTTGTNRIDYRITDFWADPPGLTDAYYSEKLIRLPRCFLSYQPLASAPPVNDLPAHTIGKITFGSFNNLPKLNPQVIALWSQILHRVPNSRIILKIRWFDDEFTRQKYLTMFAENGIESNRVKLIGLIADSSHHLAFYGNLDIALDPFPYNGTTTTCEALWMGVPVLTLAGNTHANRVGVSLLTSVGLPELIATTAEEYVDKAANLAADLNLLAQLRVNLRQKVASSPLCDALSHTRTIEETYRNLWREYCNG